MWVDKHFIEPISDQEGGRRNSKAMLVSYVMSAKRHYKPKKFTSYWCSICKPALCIDPCFRLYHTEKDYTSEVK